MLAHFNPQDIQDLEGARIAITHLLNLVEELMQANREQRELIQQQRDEINRLNGVQLQVWATWLLYTFLVDLTDAVADALKRPFKDISLEMVYTTLHKRGIRAKRMILLNIWFAKQKICLLSSKSAPQNSCL